ncbi:MAG: hypothetical protein QOG94_931 [Solirubrobacteraceae bacterium]|jgi:hypothetical protein|nr:hypothetical protein [Solirubrobacteraceae bacterium]
MRKTICMLAIAGVAAGAATQASTAATRQAELPTPGSFVSRVDNPWFPLRPGTVLVYRGVKDAKAARDVFTVTRATKVIEGVRTTVVDDRLYLRGKLAERTTDWYAQDKVGNVWYLGEKTATLDAAGKVKSTDGSWQAGVDGARAGIYMPAHPKVGQSGQQEYYKGHAEDRYEVLSLSAHVRTPAVSSRRALRTRETTPLEPNVVDEKLYVRGIGTAREQSVKGDHERLVLRSIHRP